MKKLVGVGCRATFQESGEKGNAKNEGTLPPAKVLMPCPSTSSKMFWASPNILCQTKN